MNDTGKELYKKWEEGLLQEGVCPDDWEELSDSDRAAWDFLGQHVLSRGYV